MTRRRSISFLAAAAVAAAAVAAAGCGGGSSDQSGSASPQSGAGTGTVDVASSGLGKILVDTQGRTLYLFQKDSGTTSACTGACAANWPPLRANGTPTAGNGASMAMVGTTARTDGKPQITYNGHPLYLFKGDRQPGDTNGEGLTAFGGGWFALTPAGTRIAGQAPSSGGGYGY
jgi:predicted lipoprotein with Yx(FWY)xxD motif